MLRKYRWNNYLVDAFSWRVYFVTLSVHLNSSFKHIFGILVLSPFLFFNKEFIAHDGHNGIEVSKIVFYMWTSRELFGIDGIQSQNIIIRQVIRVFIPNRVKENPNR